jgi:peptidoglycan/LPS O-acetylase OafA/YrhL
MDEPIPQDDHQASPRRLLTDPATSRGPTATACDLPTAPPMRKEGGPPSGQRKEERFDALDGVRGVAVLLVLTGHAAALPTAQHGVQLFFVLSGFLITRILLRGGEEIDNGRSAAQVFAEFYVRRTLRIMPAYYALLFVGALLDLSYFRMYMPWHAFYGSNVLMWSIGSLLGPVSHFWSLAVEEQFYLVWPLLILVIARKEVIKLCVGAIVIGCIASYALFDAEYFSALLPITQPCVFLATGSLLAAVSRSVDLRRMERICRIPALLGSAALAPIAIPLPLPLTITITPIMLAALYSWFIVAAASGHRLLAALTWMPSRYIGMISYGLYLYHFPILLAIKVNWPNNQWAEIIGTVAASFALAALSLRFFEMPIRQCSGRVLSYLIGELGALTGSWRKRSSLGGRKGSD